MKNLELTITQLENDSFKIEKNGSVYLTEVFNGDELLEMELATDGDWLDYLRTSQSYKVIG